MRKCFSQQHLDLLCVIIWCGWRFEHVFGHLSRSDVEMRELQVWLQSGTCLWNVRVHKNVKWTCRLPNKSLSLRRQEHFGLENLEYTKHLPITYIKMIKWFIHQIYIHSLTNEQHLLQQSEECSVLVKLTFQIFIFGRNKNKILPQ